MKKNDHLIDEIIDKSMSFLKPLFSNPSVTNIFINRFDNVIFRDHTGWKSYAHGFKSEVQLRTLLRQIAVKANKQFDEEESSLEAHLDNGTRISATMPPTNQDGISCTFRMFQGKRFTLQQLKELGTFDKTEAGEEAYQYTLNAIKDGENFLVVGGANSGKTTFLNAMLLALPDNLDHILLIQDSPDLFLDKPHVTRWLGKDDSEGKAIREADHMYYTMAELIQKSLRYSPDRLYVGEVRAPRSAKAFFDSLNIGVTSAGTTIHGSSAELGISRLSQLVAGEHTVDASLDYLHQESKTRIDSVFYLEKLPDARRFEGRRVLKQIMRFNESGRGIEVYNRDATSA